MRYYPLFVNLEDKDCLVIGAGGVGQRKIQSLARSGARSVTVIDPSPSDSVSDALKGFDNVTLLAREMADSDLEGKFLVIACTSNEAVNRRVSDLCDQRGILCNIADQPDRSSFIVPASVKRGDLTIAVSTSGNSPAMAKRIRRELQDHFGDEYAHILTVMGRVRPLLLDLDMKTENNTAIFRSLVNSDLLDALKGRDLDAAREILKESLPQPLHANISELLDGLV